MAERCLSSGSDVATTLERLRLSSLPCRRCVHRTPSRQCRSQGQGTRPAAGAEHWSGASELAITGSFSHVVDGELGKGCLDVDGCLLSSRMLGKAKERGYTERKRRCSPGWKLKDRAWKLELNGCVGTGWGPRWAPLRVCQSPPELPMGPPLSETLHNVTIVQRTAKVVSNNAIYIVFYPLLSISFSLVIASKFCPLNVKTYICDLFYFYFHIYLHISHFI